MPGDREWRIERSTVDVTSTSLREKRTRQAGSSGLNLTFLKTLPGFTRLSWCGNNVG
ncbi:hypothetical protein THTE_1125 [Thermogutta terrifontis]|uniref:Uncharacterized protein n=1 Tax=Thermogutta terrifontis TaxID=1331910 RepID=A0A286RCT4_9BACT|nr:hypothetical protein THTE_1125 [Thermogutta terrifontis]